MLLGCFDHIESDSSLHHTAQSQTPRCITQPRVGLLAASHSPELDSSLHHTVQSWTPRSILRTVEIMNTKSQKI